MGKDKIRERPRELLKEPRPHRLVTFVSEGQRHGIRQISLEEGRSVSDVLHRIIAQHLKDRRSIEGK